MGAGPGVLVPVTAVAAVWTGWWLHALFLFGHEAAHGNLARRRRKNDRLGDWCVWLLFGSTTAQYRRTHMTHHTHLGSHRDTETTYHLCLSVTNILKGMTGLRVLEVLLRDRRAGRRQAPAGPPRAGAGHNGAPPGKRRRRRGAARQALRGLRTPLLHLCALLRTVTEHRVLDAPCATDFTVVEHGPLNRLFGDDPLSPTFKHLLYHWDPAISCTRFREVEKFFERTPLAREMESSRAGYISVLKGMMVEAHRG
nr:fatty acid desaturase [Streptomyces sp. HNM0574]